MRSILSRMNATVWGLIFLVGSVALLVASAADAQPLCFGQSATIVGTSGDDELEGTSGNDVIVGLDGDDEIEGKGGNDLICGGDGEDKLEGDDGNDVLIGGAGNDELEGDDGDDILDGGDGTDELDGDDGFDVCLNGESTEECEDEGGEDTVSPSLTITSPNTVVVNDPVVQIEVTYADSGSGIDLNTLEILLDNVPITLTCSISATTATCVSEPLFQGIHIVSADIQDVAGNPASTAFSFALDIPGVDDFDLPVVSAVSPPDGAFVNQTTLQMTGTVTDASGVGSVTVQGQNAALTGDTFTATVTLGEGVTVIDIIATDTAGNTEFVNVALNLDTMAPTIVVSPPTPDVTNLNAIQVRGKVTDDNGVASVTIGGATVSLTDAQFDETVALQDGVNQIEVIAFDTAGNAETLVIEVERIALPQLTLTSPASRSLFTTNQVDVTGTVSDPQATVEVNGVAATVSGNTFTATAVPLAEGLNLLTATAATAANRVSTAAVTVVRDTVAPQVRIDFPADDAVVQQAAISVTGMIHDIGVSASDGLPPEVTVNGIPATVSKGAFLATDVPLVLGLNTLMVTGRDKAGNTTNASVSVTLEDNTNQPRIQAVSGNNQTGIISMTLSEPVIVAVLDASGAPVPNQTVIFKVVLNNGAVSGDGGINEAVAVAVTTDASGQAQAESRAGSGIHRVEASAVGFSGRAVFTATAIPGAPTRIYVDEGGTQFGVVGQPLPRPFVAVVTDARNNRLENVPVTFTVVSGGGEIEGQTAMIIMTDADGLARATLTLGPDAGFDNNLAEATFPGNPGFPASFAASSKVAGDPADTQVSGVVLDNTNQPLEGVTVQVDGTGLSTQTDDQGQFGFQPAPVGRVKLLVDGSTTQRPGTWPNLAFELVTIAGQNNTIGMPIYLLPLDTPNAIFVDETQGGTLTLPQFPGFALSVAPGSALFADGSRSGEISVTVVHLDKVPMTPNFGQQPRFIVTIQPSDVQFTTPAVITYPNVDALAPRTVTDLYSFDHDQGRFITIGTGTVSNDGLTIQSDPGVGLVKGGWHCGAVEQEFGSSGGLKVSFEKSQVKLMEDEMVLVVAKGAPQPDAIYTDWRSDDTNIVDFVTRPECPDQGSCEAQIAAMGFGKTNIHVTFMCTTTMQSVSAMAEVVVSKEFEINVTTFIPFAFGLPGVPTPFPPIGLTIITGEGDNRGFDPNATSFRTRQTGTFVVGDSPITVEGPNTVARDSVLHVVDASGNIDLLPLFSLPGKLKGFSVTLTRLSDESIRVEMTGSAHTALLPAALDIDWCYDIEIDNPPDVDPMYRISGGNDNYPAYEVYINDK